MTGDESRIKRSNVEDLFLDSLETVCSLLDNLYLLKSFNIISKDNRLYKKLNKNNLVNKIWFLTLILSIRKEFKAIVSAVRFRSKLQNELRSLGDKTNLLNNVLKEKMIDTITSCDVSIRNNFLELLQNLFYLGNIAIELFKLNVPKRLKSILETASSFMTIIKFFNQGFSINV